MTDTPGLTEIVPHDALKMPDVPSNATSSQLKQWRLARAAIPYLKGVSSQEYGYVSYKTLDAHWREETGENIGHPLNWGIGEVLGKVAEICELNVLPWFPALVVRKDNGKTGQGFDYVPALAGRIEGFDEQGIQRVAAEMRLECYQHFCPKLREYARWRHTEEYVNFRRKKEEELGPLEDACGECGTQLPGSERCDQGDCPSNR